MIWNADIFIGLTITGIEATDGKCISRGRKDNEKPGINSGKWTWKSKPYNPPACISKPSTVLFTR